MLRRPLATPPPRSADGVAMTLQQTAIALDLNLRLAGMCSNQALMIAALWGLLWQLCMRI
jgi:hypothetical protein